MVDMVNCTFSVLLKLLTKYLFTFLDQEKAQRVKDLYKTLGLPSTYAIYEEESYNMIKTHIQQTSRGVPHEIFLQILNKIYQRDA